MKRANNKHKQFLASMLAVLLLLLSACGRRQEGDPSVTTAAAAAAAETTQSDGTSAPSEQPGNASAPSEQPGNASAPSEQPGNASAPSEQPGGTSAPSGQPGGASAPAGPVTVTDMTGREITLDEPADRVVALTPSDCEILYAIGAGDTLVGRGEYCDYPAEVLEVPAVNSGSDTNVEQILELEPQVLLMSTMAQTEEQVRQLENAGVHVVVSDAQDIEGTYTAIEMIGALMGKDDEAAAVVSGMRDAFAGLEEKSAGNGSGSTSGTGNGNGTGSESVSKSGNGSGSVYFEVSPLEYGLWAAGSHTFMNEVAEMLGLTNCFADVDGWGSVSEEQVLDRDPDYIVTITMYYGEGPTPEEEILSRPGWENVTAVKNGAVLNLPNNELSRPGPRLADGAKALYEFVYGDEE